MQNRILSTHRTRLLAGVLSLGLLALPAAGVVLMPNGTQAAAAATASLATMERAPASFAPLVDKVRPAVVSVQVRKAIKGSQFVFGNNPEFKFNFPKGSPFEEFFKRFQRGPNGQGRAMPKKPETPRYALAQGSGFIISEDGYVVTNNHVVSRDGKITIVLDNGKRYSAKRIGLDKKTDLALLKIKGKGPFPYVRFADQEARVGDWVVAIGNPFGLGGTVTVGVVSARGRDIGQGNYDDFLQIDAPINKGNSGGPTFNLKGEVVGVNTAIFSPSGGSVGIGFAIPSEQARQIIAQLKAEGRVQRGWLGVQIQKISDDIAASLGLDQAYGALVTKVTEKSPAARAGLKVGDVILDLNGKKVKDPRDLARKVAALPPKTSNDLTIMRQGKRQGIKVVLGQLKTADVKVAGESETQSTALDELGLSLSPVEDGNGVRISRVTSGSEAEEKGLRAGQIILEVGGVSVASPADVEAQIARMKKAGRKVVLLLLRSGDSNRFVALTIKAG